jgi:protein subunit release factor A
MNMELSQPYLRVWLLSDTPSAAFFVADICAMLEAIARRSGDSLLVPDEWANPANAARDRRASLDGELTPALQGEVGFHRAQFVPVGSSDGRIETVKVRVEVVGTTTPQQRPAAEHIVRTYSYPLRRCTHHPSGRSASLDDVLAGAG